MASENIIMAMVKAGGNRQVCWFMQYRQRAGQMVTPAHQCKSWPGCAKKNRKSYVTDVTQKTSISKNAGSV